MLQHGVLFRWTDSLGQYTWKSVELKPWLRSSLECSVDPVFSHSQCAVSRFLGTMRRESDGGLEYGTVSFPQGL